MMYGNLWENFSRKDIIVAPHCILVRRPFSHQNKVEVENFLFVPIFRILFGRRCSFDLKVSNQHEI